MTKQELEDYADKYLIERFGAKTGNQSVRSALIDGYNLALGIHDVSSSLPLGELERRLDEQLGKETKETLLEWLNSKRL